MNIQKVIDYATSSFLSMGEDSHDSLNFGGVQSDMRPFGQQFHCNTYNDGSATASSSSPQGMYMSRLPTIPSTTEYPGDWGFEISFGPLTESASKSATWTYSDVCKKLYVNLASFCPIKFKTRMQPPSGTVLRAVAVFKGSTNLHDVVKRCPNHMESSSDGSAPKDQFIRSNNPAAHYHTCPESMRHSVMLPYNGPQVGTEFVTEMFAFMCFSSCASGPSRRPVEVIFTLEKDGQTLGRRVVEIRVCACPGRDRKSDEKAVCGEPTSSQGVGKRARRGSGNKGPGAKRRRTSSRTSSEEEYVVTTRNRHVYELLMDFKEKLEDKFEYFHLQNLDNSLVLSTSEDETEQPSTSAGSPGSVFKRGGLSTM
ncbi:tumor protein p73-like isoform X12 [Montipora foliosa]|uniref:tumor protein p73-like isoform X12 n=1 Tax=Montipora foliosa TaxID=591990 RepID=UPI0035F1CD62